MEKKSILSNKYYLYLTEFFAGMAVMAVELGASRLLAPYFSFFPDCVDHYYRNDYDSYGSGKYLGRTKRRQRPQSGPAVQKNFNRGGMDCPDSRGGKIYYPRNLSTADLYRQQQFPHHCSICSLHGDLRVPLIFTGNRDPFSGKIFRGQSR